MIALLALAIAAPSDLFEVDATVEHLPNGMKVIVEQRTRTDEVALRMHLAVGSADEDDGERGLAHLLEHLMFEGSENVPGNAFDAWLSEAGGENNASTAEDATVFYAAFPSGALDLALFLESDRWATAGSSLSASSLRNQIGVVLRERSQSYSSPHGRDFDALSRLLYPQGHPYHVPVIGTRQDVRGATLDGAQAFFSRWYRPAHATLALVGNVEPTQALQKVRWWFSDVPDQEPMERSWPEPPPRHAQRQDGFLMAEVDDSTLHLAWVGPAASDPDVLAVRLAATVLGDGRGSRIGELPFRRRFIRSARVQAWNGERDGLFLISGSVTRGARLGRLERLLRRELLGLVRSPPTQAELDRARMRLRRRLLDPLERPQSRARVLVECLRLYGDPDCSRTQWRELQALGPEDVVRAVQRVIDEPGARLFVVPRWEVDRLPGSAALVELP
ncbi:MAG: insulinase family protein [Deltaproteobacteria bacterium]|nr:MAG: insulinase family protein [Deltaproteobacteria bacterium]